mgnify:CR=1 FL=1
MLPLVVSHREQFLYFFYLKKGFLGPPLEAPIFIKKSSYKARVGGFFKKSKSQKIGKKMSDCFVQSKNGHTEKKVNLQKNRQKIFSFVDFAKKYIVKKIFDKPVSGFHDF